MKKQSEEKKTMEEKFIDALDKWDAFSCRIAPHYRYRRSIKGIARKWERELKKVIVKDQEEPLFFRVHMPVEALRFLPENYFTLSFFSHGFQPYNDLSSERSTLFWVSYQKHPAYAVYDMTKNDEYEILDGIRIELEKNKKSLYLYDIQPRKWVVDRFTSHGVSQEWELVATLK